MSERRAATHNGRAGKHGAYSAKHNDRHFDMTQVDHIDPTLSDRNWNWKTGGDYGAATNEDHEQAFYEAHFSESLERKNAGYRQKGKAGQIKTMEQYRRAPKSCPEETYYSIGSDADPELLKTIYLEHQAWRAERFPLYQTLDADLHVDEPNAMVHIHERGVWLAHDAQGMLVVGQAKALSEMGVLPPEPDKKYGKHNNAKMTYTRECREHFLGVCRRHGLEIEETPKDSQDCGLELMDYKAHHARERAAEAQQAEAEARAATEVIRGQIEQQSAELKAVTEALAAAQATFSAHEVNALQGRKTITGGLKGVTWEEFERLKQTAAKVDTMAAERDAANALAARAQKQAEAAMQERPSIKVRVHMAELENQVSKLQKRLDAIMNYAVERGVQLWREYVQPLHRENESIWTFAQAWKVLRSRNQAPSDSVVKEVERLSVCAGGTDKLQQGIMERLGAKAEQIAAVLRNMRGDRWQSR